jgi:hypothetical protein
LSSILVALALGAGCSKKSDESAPSPSASVSAAPTPAGDAALAAQLASISKACAVDSKTGAATCPSGEKQKLVGEFVANKRSRIAALDTMTTAIASTDPQLSALTAAILYEAFRANLGPEATPGSVTQSQARRISDLLTKLPVEKARQLAPLAAHASVLAGDMDHLYAVLERNPSLGMAAYRYLMVYGRLDTFEKIKKLAEDKRAPIQLAALEAPRNMPNWSAKDRAAICPWAQPLLVSDNTLVSSKAAALLSRCAGEFVDGLLLQGEASLTNGTFSKAQVAAYRELCSAQRRRTGGATDTQCARNRKLLEGVVKNEKLDAGVRAMALMAISNQWPDDGALALAKAQQNQKQPELAQAGAQTVTRLETRALAAPSASQKRPEAKTR